MEPFRLGSRYYFSRLNEEEKITYRRIYDFWHAGGTEARILMPGLGFQFPSGLPLFDLVTYILEDNPHLFHLEITHFHYQRQGAYVTITTNNVYTPEEYQQIYTQLIRRTGEIVQMARRYSTDVEKLRFLHDYLAQSVTYRKDESNPRTAREIHTIVGSLLNRFCVCDGYARAFRLLCDQLHISCIVVSGTGHSAADTGPHAWNVVKFDSNVYHVDVTWDSNLGVVAGELSDYYFLRGDRFFFQDHSWDASLYHPIPKDYPRPCLTQTLPEMEQYICSQVRKGLTMFRVELPEAISDSAALMQAVTDIIRRNPKVFRFRRLQSTQYYPAPLRTGVLRFSRGIL